jgi:hypothetical protein
MATCPLAAMPVPLGQAARTPIASPAASTSRAPRTRLDADGGTIGVTPIPPMPMARTAAPSGGAERAVDAVEPWPLTPLPCKPPLPCADQRRLFAPMPSVLSGRRALNGDGIGDAVDEPIGDDRRSRIGGEIPTSSSRLSAASAGIGGVAAFNMRCRPGC